MDKYFEYKLTPYPTSLLKDGLVRLSLSKSLLKNHVLRPCSPCDRPDREAIVDGGDLLWSGVSKRNFNRLLKYI